VGEYPTVPSQEIGPGLHCCCWSLLSCWYVTHRHGHTITTELSTTLCISAMHASWGCSTLQSVHLTYKPQWLQSALCKIPDTVALVHLCTDYLVLLGATIASISDTGDRSDHGAALHGITQSVGWSTRG